jgi:hypothetical protein
MSAEFDTGKTHRRGVESEWSKHAKTRWRQRSKVDRDDFGQLFVEAKEVDYPGARGDARGMYHCGGEVILLVCRDWRPNGELVDEVVTAISLSDRSKTEQQTIKRMAGEQS